MKILAIIPARCGSKGIVDKNIVDVCGKPLITYSIDTAHRLLEHNAITRAIVSTDCEKIAQVATAHGADVPFLRPSSLAGDTSKPIEYILHALNSLEEGEESYDAVLLLQPTSPIRPIDIMLDAISQFKKSGAKSLISCYSEEYINDLVMYREGQDKDKKLIPLNENHNKGFRRQEHGGVFVRNGALYITRVEHLRETGYIISDRPLLVEMKKADSVNVDNMNDLEMLRTIMCSKTQQKGNWG